MTNTQPTSQSSGADGPVGTAQPVADLSRAPLPTPATLRRRRSIPFQLTRFAVFNARIMRMVLKGRH